MPDTDVAERPTLPEVLGDEDNETFWTPGHISPHLFIRAVLRYMRDPYSGWDDESVAEWLQKDGGHLGLVAKVKHVAFRYCDPNNDEAMAPCEHDHPEAELFTEVRVYG